MPSGGSNCRLFFGYHIPSGEDCVVKVLPKSDAKSATEAAAVRHISTLRMFCAAACALECAEYRVFPQTRAVQGHPAVVRLIDEEEDDRNTYLILERCVNDVVHELELAEHGLPPRKVRTWFTQVVQGIAHCHARGVYHGDVKPENVLLTRDGLARLSDFGSAAMARVSTPVSCSLSYSAPEVLVAVGGRPQLTIVTSPITHPGAVVSPASRAVDHEKADVWSLGIMLYVLYVGLPPFEEASLRSDAFKQLTQHKWKVHPKLPRSARDLFLSMLQVEPGGRPSVTTLLQSLNLLWHHPRTSKQASRRIASYVPRKLAVNLTQVADVSDVEYDSDTDAAAMFQSLNPHIGGFDSDSVASSLALESNDDLESFSAYGDVDSDFDGREDEDRDRDRDADADVVDGEALGGVRTPPDCEVTTGSPLGVPVRLSIVTTPIVTSADRGNDSDAGYWSADSTVSLPAGGDGLPQPPSAIWTLSSTKRGGSAAAALSLKTGRSSFFHLPTVPSLSNGQSLSHALSHGEVFTVGKSTSKGRVKRDRAPLPVSVPLPSTLPALIMPSGLASDSCSVGSGRSSDDSDASSVYSGRHSVASSLHYETDDADEDGAPIERSMKRVVSHDRLPPHAFTNL